MIDCPEVELKYISVGVVRTAINKVAEKELLQKYEELKKKSIVVRFLRLLIYSLEEYKG